MPEPIKIRNTLFNWENIPYIMGILNVTPDSFSDGGEAITLEGALEKAEMLIKAGAHIIDVGGESTRPFSDPIPAEEEIKRVIPLIKALREKYSEIVISVDTYKVKVAEFALKAGADMINDISGGQFDPKILDVVKDYQCPYILMHIKGTPKTMQINPQYDDVINEIKEYFRERIEICLKKGIQKKNIILDPGLGFGKTFTHNLEILKHLEAFKEFDCPLLLGPSRKSFIGEILQKPPKDRDAGTAGVAIYAYLKGVHFLRVHNVSVINDTLKIFKYLWKD
ncbi:MAG: dihydropteroate synthase [Caldimicrobium sp.]